ncbi:MAG: helix-turn-helix transcriptional regulator [Bryobacteraceae bacterium]
MPTLVPITARSLAGRRPGEYVVLEAAFPSQPAANLGVLLLDPASDRLWIRMRQDFSPLFPSQPIDSQAGSRADSEDGLIPELDPGLLPLLESDMRKEADRLGGAAWLESLEDSLSNVLRVSGRRRIAVDSFTRALDRLYEEHVEPLEVGRFVTHLPLYALRAAAGRLGEEMEAAEEDWVRAPEGLRLTPDLFVAHVVGRSMEPRIPDGSLNLFRLHPAGSRQNKILLIQRYGVTDESARYTVKKYTSTKVAVGEDQWRHERVRLEPLNPEYEAWDVGPEDFAVVAEWLRVIE